MARSQADITHCPRGHEYSEENTRWRQGYNKPDGAMSRVCKQCDRDIHAARAIDSTAKRPTRTHCNRGHELTTDNTYYLGKSKKRACRTCNLAVAAKSRSKNSASRRDYELRTNYGITLTQFNEMYDDQDGLCAICGSSPQNHVLRVDHDHDTGEVRKLLCCFCNTALGFAKDDPQILRTMAKYLEDHGR